MRITRTLRSMCGTKLDCDRIEDTDDPRYVLIQGTRVDPATVGREIPAHEALLQFPRDMITQVGGGPMLTLDELGEYVGRHHRHDLFRLETLNNYAATSDAGEYGLWRSGAPGPDLDGKRGWLDALVADHRAGRNWRRVHIIDQPLTDYLAYETSWCYVPNSEAGEDIRILDLSESSLPPGLGNVGDFFVVDGSTVIRMHYTDAAFAGASIVDHAPEAYVALRDLLWAAAEPFAAWWARHPELHQSRRAA